MSSGSVSQSVASQVQGVNQVANQDQSNSSENPQSTIRQVSSGATPQVDKARQTTSQPASLDRGVRPAPKPRQVQSTGIRPGAVAAAKKQLGINDQQTRKQLDRPAPLPKPTADSRQRTQQGAANLRQPNRSASVNPQRLSTASSRSDSVYSRSDSLSSSSDYTYVTNQPRFEARQSNTTIPSNTGLASGLIGRNPAPAARLDVPTFNSRGFQPGFPTEFEGVTRQQVEGGDKNTFFSGVANAKDALAAIKKYKPHGYAKSHDGGLVLRFNDKRSSHAIAPKVSKDTKYAQGQRAVANTLQTILNKTSVSDSDRAKLTAKILHLKDKPNAVSVKEFKGVLEQIVKAEKRFENTPRAADDLYRVVPNTLYGTQSEFGDSVEEHFYHELTNGEEDSLYSDSVSLRSESISEGDQEPVRPSRAESLEHTYESLDEIYPPYRLETHTPESIAGVNDSDLPVEAYAVVTLPGHEEPGNGTGTVERFPVESHYDIDEGDGVETTVNTRGTIERPPIDPPAVPSARAYEEPVSDENFDQRFAALVNDVRRELGVQRDTQVELLALHSPELVDFATGGNGQPLTFDWIASNGQEAEQFLTDRQQYQALGALHEAQRLENRRNSSNSLDAEVRRTIATTPGLEEFNSVFERTEAPPRELETPALINGIAEQIKNEIIEEEHPLIDGVSREFTKALRFIPLRQSEKLTTENRDLWGARFAYAIDGANRELQENGASATLNRDAVIRRSVKLALSRVKAEDIQ